MACVGVSVYVWFWWMRDILMCTFLFCRTGKICKTVFLIRTLPAGWRRAPMTYKIPQRLSIQGPSACKGISVPRKSLLAFWWVSQDVKFQTTSWDQFFFQMRRAPDPRHYQWQKYKLFIIIGGCLLWAVAFFLMPRSRPDLSFFVKVLKTDSDHYLIHRNYKQKPSTTKDYSIADSMLKNLKGPVKNQEVQAILLAIHDHHRGLCWGGLVDQCLVDSSRTAPGWSGGTGGARGILGPRGWPRWHGMSSAGPKNVQPILGQKFNA